MQTELYSSQTGLNPEEVRSQMLVSTRMTQALIRLQEQTPWVNWDVRERADREENVDVEGETSKWLCVAFLSCDPKQKNNCGGCSWEPTYLQALPPSAETVCYEEPTRPKPRLRTLHSVGQILAPLKSREALPMGTCSVLFTPSLATPLLEAFRVCKW